MARDPDKRREADEPERREAEHDRGALDPGLKEQRDRAVVRDHPSRPHDADALQRPHLEPDEES